MLSGMVKYLVSKKVAEKTWFGSGAGKALASGGVAFFEAINKFDDMVRSTGLPKATKEFDYMEAQFLRQYNENLPHAIKGRDALIHKTKRCKGMLSRDHPKVNFDNKIWIADPTEIHQSGKKVQKLQRGKMVFIPSCTGFIVRQEKGKCYIEVDPRAAGQILPGMAVESTQGVKQGTVTNVNHKLGSVTVKRNGLTAVLPFNTIRPASGQTFKPVPHSASQPVQSGSDNLWFWVSMVAIFLLIICVFVISYLILRKPDADDDEEMGPPRRSARSGKLSPPAASSRRLSPRRYRSRSGRSRSRRV